LDEEDTVSQDEIESALRGKTLRVYWWLLSHPGSHSGREVQRELGLSSPSLAIYHIDKLKDIGLVRTDRDGMHHVSREVSAGLLKFFANVGHFIFPRYLFYALFYTSSLLLMPVLFPIYPSPILIICYAVLAFGAVSSWYETVRIWRCQPF
jgi:hypothetical protein